jgi:hypothetical protein
MSDTITADWPASLPVAQVRVARPTDRLADVEKFYAEDLGLPVLYRFHDHDGYDGLMLGLPGGAYHLEFTSRHGGSAPPAPTPENLLVLYFRGDADMCSVVERLGAAGHQPVLAENPFWGSVGGLTFEDPDGFRVVLVPRPVSF